MRRIPFFTPQPGGDMPEVSQEEADRLLEQWKAQHPFASSGDAPKFRIRAGAASAGKTQPGEVQPDGLGTRIGKPETLAPNRFVSDALRKRPGERTLQEVQAIKERRRYEEIAEKQGYQVKGGIRDQVTAEEVEPTRARAEVAGSVARAEEKLAGYAQHGYKADGTRMTPEEQAAQKQKDAPPAAKPGSGGTIEANGLKTTVAPGTADQSGQATQGRGFAMREMGDGSVRVASGLNRPVEAFDSRAAALAIYRPSTPSLQNPAGAMPTPVAAAAKPAPQAAAQPQAAAEPQTMVPPAATGQPAAQPVVQTDPAKAKTTSPTAQLGMNGTSTPTTPAKPDAQPAAAPAAPAKDGLFATPFQDELKAQGQYSMTPMAVGRDVAFNVFSAAKGAADLSTRATDAVSEKIGDVFGIKMRAATAGRDVLGTPPKVAGYQQQAEELKTY